MTKTGKMVQFNKLTLTGLELTYLEQALESGELAGNGAFTKRIHEWLEKNLGSKAAFFTSSGTSALEMAALLLDPAPGDEVIVPSFTFVTSASAFVRAGMVPVFVDIDSETLNIDPKAIEKAISPRTRAIVPVHYASVACDMEAIQKIAHKYDLRTIEDAAHAFRAEYRGAYLGGIGDFAALSFHQTKNIVGGEGGALLVNNLEYLDKAYCVWQKGTNRHEMDAGLTDKYVWSTLGSSFPASELTAAMILGQLDKADEINAKRVACWNFYNQALEPLEARGCVRRPVVPSDCKINGHIYYLLAANADERTRLLEHLNDNGVEAVFHYVPLHSSPAGKRYGKVSGSMENTDSISARIVRLPIWSDISSEDMKYVVDTIEKFYS